MMKNSYSSYNTFFVIFSLALSLLPSCTHKSNVDRQNLYVHQQQQQKRTCKPETVIPPAITIYIHGTLIFRKPSYYKTFKENSFLSAQELPQDHYFYRLAKTISNKDPVRFPFEEFYFYIWSGKLSDNERKIAAENLHQFISDICIKYKEKYGTTPTISIIAHSHGGNVALKMASIEPHSSCFTIQSLILLACPVQERTMHLIGKPLFNRVYSLYSGMDIIQIIAPQILKNQIPNEKRRRYKFPPFSWRQFPNQRHLTQAKIKIDSSHPSHTKFTSLEFIDMLPTILVKMDNWHQDMEQSLVKQKQKLLCVYTKK